MHFNRVNEDTVRCIITKEELAENGLTVDDFLTNNGKTEEFLKKMIRMAHEEVDFKIVGGPLAIQVALLPDDTMALTFSEKQFGPISDFIEGLKQAMSQLGETVKEKGLKNDGNTANAKIPKMYLFGSRELENLKTFCKSVNYLKEETDEFNTSLFYETESKTYYLLIASTNTNDLEYRKIISSGVEFFDISSFEEPRIAGVMEHSKCLISTGALGTFGRM